MNILLIGERFSPNLGDGVIYESVEKMCKEIYSEKVNLICLDISGGNSYKKDEKTISFKEKIKSKLSFLRKKLSEMKRINAINKKLYSIELEKIDGAIFVGGQLFSEYFSKPIYTISKKLSEYNIPIIFNCCGLGKNDKAKYVNYLNQTFQFPNIKAISVRDNYAEFIKKYKVELNKVQIIMDPVIECSNYIKVSKRDDKIFGIGIMDPKLYIKNGISFDDNYYFNFFKNIIEELNKRNIKWEFFCNGRINDYDFAKKICIHLNIKENKIARRPTTPIELIELINKYSNLISFRLHSHIIAYSYNIPTIGFCWDKKVKDFGKSINNSEFFLEIDDNINENFNKIVDLFISSNIKKESIYKLSSVFLKENKFEAKK